MSFHYYFVELCGEGWLLFCVWTEHAQGLIGKEPPTSCLVALVSPGIAKPGRDATRDSWTSIGDHIHNLPFETASATQLSLGLGRELFRFSSRILDVARNSSAVGY
jgi:hypothetical protein